MPSLFLLSRRHAPAVVALLAMLMLLIAPSISKSLAQQHAATPAEQHVHRMMHGDHERVAPAVEKTPIPHHFLPAPGASLMDDIACGYCQLLLHIPLIVWIFIPFIWLTLHISLTPPSAPAAPPSTLSFYPRLQPRAPPSQP